MDVQEELIDYPQQ
jgi:hypothetical protein